ncbi:MAG: Membrane bound containing D-sorbitol dehydrogenase [Thermomicrobiales bacterium]|jgi:hypothetical protein|nr:Membrane bound containing D-sorbitol dehydrogenase [Thermomicrobiales bacterium]
MTNRRTIALSDREILARLLTRRGLVRTGAGGALLAGPALLGAVPVNESLAQTPSASGDDGTTIYEPATPVGAATPETTGPTQTAVGPPPGDASPVPGVPIAAFMDLSLALVGGGRLDEDRGAQLLVLIAADADRRAALDGLLAIRAGAAATPIATPVAALSDAQRTLVEQILRFWYLGTYDDQPVTDRAGFWFGLSAWQAVQYTYATSVCRAFGIWAQPPQT